MALPLLLLGGCTPRVSATDRALLAPETLLSIERRPTDTLRINLPLMRGPDLKASLTASILATRGTTEKPVLEAALPELRDRQWVRATPLPAAGPLFAPVDLLAAALVLRMGAAGEVSLESARCLSSADCPTAELTLELEVTEVQLTIFPGPPGAGLGRFEARAALRTRANREVWHGSCALENLTLAIDAPRSTLERIQALLDAASLQCVAAIDKQLQESLTK